MRNPWIRKLGGLTLAMVVLVAALPAAARDTAPAADFDLALDAALEAQGSTFGLASEAGTRSEAAAAVAPEIDLSEVRAQAWVPAEGEEDPAPAAQPEKKGFGRWLKKHWYVPVLAAVALGVALDDGDNDASGEED